jgi:hypothetical protein
MESTNKDMTDSFERSTKRYESVNKEMLVVSQRQFHIDTILEKAQAVLHGVVQDDDVSSNIYGHSNYFITCNSVKKVCVHRLNTARKWIFGGTKEDLPWHPQFNSQFRIGDLLNYCPSIYDGNVDSIILLRQIKFVPKVENTKLVVEFMLHCDPKFEVNAYSKRSEESRVPLSRFSVCQYLSVCTNVVCVGQVIGIVLFNEVLQIIVSKLEEEHVDQSFRKLPYPLYKYAEEPEDRTRFTFEHDHTRHKVFDLIVTVEPVCREMTKKLYHLEQTRPAPYRLEQDAKGSVFRRVPGFRYFGVTLVSSGRISTRF